MPPPPNLDDFSLVGLKCLVVFEMLLFAFSFCPTDVQADLSTDFYMITSSPEYLPLTILALRSQALPFIKINSSPINVAKGKTCLDFSL